MDSDRVDSGLVIAGKYHVVQLIAQGGMGVVYDAIHAKTGRRVALKLIKERGLSGGPAALRRFEREAKAAGAIDSLHVVQVLDAGEDDASGMPFMVMEYLQGEDLRTVLARGALPPDQAIAIATQVCLGLVRAHAADIIHRDLKPANLFLAEADGDQRIVKILDFGIAKLLGEESRTHDLTGTGDIVGSPPYMSPEQLVSPRDVDHRTDLWSLGVVLYEMLCGVTPTSGLGPIGTRVYAICHLPAPPLATQLRDVRPALAALVHRALAVDPDARFASAEEMLEALRELQPETIALRDGDLRIPRTPLSPSTSPTALDLAPTELERPVARFASRAGWAAAAAFVTMLGGLYASRHAHSPAAASAPPIAATAASSTVVPSAVPAAVVTLQTNAPEEAALPDAGHAEATHVRHAPTIMAPRRAPRAPASPASRKGAATVRASTGREQL